MSLYDIVIGEFTPVPKGVFTAGPNGEFADCLMNEENCCQKYHSVFMTTAPATPFAFEFTPIYVFEV